LPFQGYGLLAEIVHLRARHPEPVHAPLDPLHPQLPRRLCGTARVLQQQPPVALGVHVAPFAPPAAHHRDEVQGLALLGRHRADVAARFDLLETVHRIGAAQPYPELQAVRLGARLVVHATPAGAVVGPDRHPRTPISSHRRRSPWYNARRCSVPSAVSSQISAPCGRTTPYTLYSRMTWSTFGTRPSPTNGGSSTTHPATASRRSSSVPP